MKQYGLGIDEATKALTISRALRKTMETSSGPAEAIRALTSKISLSNLLYESSDEDPNSCDENSVRRTEMKIDPMPGLDRQVNSSRIKTAGTRKAKAGTKAVKSKPKTPSKTGIAGRKRSADDLTPGERKEASNMQTRERSDSVSVEVDAKIANSVNEESASSETSKRAPAVRAKRVHRNDDAEASLASAPHKRIRVGES